MWDKRLLEIPKGAPGYSIRGGDLVYICTNNVINRGGAISAATNTMGTTLL